VKPQRHGPPLVSRWAPEIYGLKTSKSDRSRYSQTILLVRGSTSITRE